MKLVNPDTGEEVCYQRKDLDKTALAYGFVDGLRTMADVLGAYPECKQLVDEYREYIEFLARYYLDNLPDFEDDGDDVLAVKL